MAFNPFEHIDDYVAGKLSRAAVRVFEKELVSNDELVAAVAEQREMAETFDQYDPELFNMLDEIAATNPPSGKPVKKKKKQRWWIVLLVISALLITLLYWFTTLQKTVTEEPNPTNIDSLRKENFKIFVSSDSTKKLPPQVMEPQGSIIIIATHGINEPLLLPEDTLAPSKPPPEEPEEPTVDVFAVALDYARPSGEYYLQELAPSLKGGQENADTLALIISSGDLSAALVMLDTSTLESAAGLLARGYLRLRENRTSEALEDFETVVKDYGFHAADAQFLRLITLATTLPEGLDAYQEQLSLVIQKGEPYASKALKLDQALR